MSCGCGCGGKPAALGSVAQMCGPYGCAPPMRGLASGLPPSVSNLQAAIGAVLPPSVSNLQAAIGATMGGVVGTWWSDVDAQKARLDPSFIATNADVQKCGSVLQPGELAAWNAFYASWVAFRSDPGGWLFGSGEAYDLAMTYEQQLNAWRAQLKADGCGQSAPDLPAPIGTEIPSAVKWTAAAVIAASLAYVALSFRKVV